MADLPPFVVALTGGIAAGKSLVSDQFAALGVPIIDADVVARQVVAPGSTGLEILCESFGPTIIDAKGHLDRAALRQRVFANPDELKTLNTILHPLIGQAMQTQVRQAEGDYVLAVIPLLCETPPRSWVDRVLLIQTCEKTRRQRLMRRDGISQQLANQMLAAQCSDSQRLQLADDIILNEDAPETVTPRVQTLHTFYLQLAHSRQLA